jgi:hypothetical protein
VESSAPGLLQFRCPLTRCLMLDPVMAPDGFTYERAAIEDWLSVHGTSPVTLASPFPITDLVPNLTMRAAMHLLGSSR